MRIARARTEDGVLEGEYDDGTLHAETGSYAVDPATDLLVPCRPSALYCVGRNYAATIEQMDYERPAEPDFFVKPPASLLDPGAAIPYPTFTRELTYAGELAAVVGERCHRVAPGDVPDVVRGYTALNDVDALDQQSRTARKAFDGSGPLGPWIETDLDPTALAMRTTIDGDVRQEASTAQMLFDPYEVVAFLSERFTLRPGDVVSFGSPANSGTVEPGDEIDVWYEGIGHLRNTVAPPDPAGRHRWSRGADGGDR